MDKKYRLNTILFGVIITLLVLILVKNSPNYVAAQVSPGSAAARTGHMLAIVGSKTQANRESFYLVDTRQEVIMVYEYGVQGEGLGLVTTRSYRYDKQLEQYGRTYFGPKVDQIKKELEKVRK